MIFLTTLKGGVSVVLVYETPYVMGPGGRDYQGGNAYKQILK
jgi:hypothetical protein